MSEIGLKKGIALFVLLFVVPPIALQPVRPMLVDIVPDPTLWQSVAMFVGQLLIAGVAVYAYKQRNKALETANESDTGPKTWVTER